MQQLMKFVEAPDISEVCETPMATGGLQIWKQPAHSGITSPKVRLSRKLPKRSKPLSGRAAKAFHMAKMRRIQVLAGQRTGAAGLRTQPAVYSVLSLPITLIGQTAAPRSSYRLISVKRLRLYRLLLESPCLAMLPLMNSTSQALTFPGLFPFPNRTTRAKPASPPRRPIPLRDW